MAKMIEAVGTDYNVNIRKLAMDGRLTDNEEFKT